MTDTLDDNTLDAHQQEAIRAEVRRVQGDRPMTKVAQEAGVAYGTFSNWMGNTYLGRTSDIARKAQRWIDAQAAMAQKRAEMPIAPGYIATPTSLQFISLLEHAQYAPELVLLSSSPGLGKTTSIIRHQATNPNVFLLTCEPCFSTPRMVLDTLAQTLDLTEKYSSQTVSRAIQRRLRGSGGLLVVDEAQHLTSPSIDQLRTLHDLAGIGVAIVGNETVNTRIEGFGRQAQFAQLFSRIGMRITRLKATQEDVRMILDAWNVEGVEERRLLTWIAKQPGSLRGITKTMRLAHMLADGKPVTTDLIRRSWERISNTKIIAEAA
jgi:hypothetical protein